MSPSGPAGPSGRSARASDVDRDHTLWLLKEHHVAGRLTAGELHERVAAALTANTLDELDDLVADLPHIDRYELPDASIRRPPPR